jgi:hypothetical protein
MGGIRMAVSPLQKSELLSYLAYLNANLGQGILNATNTTELKSEFNKYQRRIDKLADGKDYASRPWYGVRHLKPADPICPWCGRRFTDETEYEDHLRTCGGRRNPVYD